MTGQNSKIAIKKSGRFSMLLKRMLCTYIPSHDVFNKHVFLY